MTSLYDGWCVEALTQEREALQWRLAELTLSPDPDESESAILGGMAFVADWIGEIDQVLEKRRGMLRGGHGPNVARPARTDIFRHVSERIDLLSFCARYGPVLRQSGPDSWFGLCLFPDHHETTPSFHVTPSKNLWNCFGCGRGGDLFHLAMAIYQTPSTIEAARKLAAEFGIEIEEQRKYGNSGGHQVATIRDAQGNLHEIAMRQPRKRAYSR